MNADPDIGNVEDIVAHKFAILLLIVALLNFTVGCTTTEKVWMEREEFSSSIPDVPTGSDRSRIVKVQCRDGAVITFDKDGAIYRESFRGQDSVIVGFTDEGEAAVTKLNQVDMVWIESTETNVGGTVILGLGIVAGSMLLGLMTVSMTIIEKYE